MLLLLSMFILLLLLLLFVEILKTSSGSQASAAHLVIPNKLEIAGRKILFYRHIFMNCICKIGQSIDEINGWGVLE